MLRGLKTLLTLYTWITWRASAHLFLINALKSHWQFTWTTFVFLYFFCTENSLQDTNIFFHLQTCSMLFLPGPTSHEKHLQVYFKNTLEVVSFH